MTAFPLSHLLSERLGGHVTPLAFRFSLRPCQWHPYVALPFPAVILGAYCAFSETTPKSPGSSRMNCACFWSAPSTSCSGSTGRAGMGCFAGIPLLLTQPFLPSLPPQPSKWQRLKPKVAVLKSLWQVVADDNFTGIVGIAPQGSLRFMGEHLHSSQQGREFCLPRGFTYCSPPSAVSILPYAAPGPPWRLRSHPLQPSCTFPTNPKYPWSHLPGHPSLSSFTCSVLLLISHQHTPSF